MPTAKTQTAEERAEAEAKYAPKLPKQVQDQLKAYEEFTQQGKPLPDEGAPQQDPGFEKEGIPVQPTSKEPDKQEEPTPTHPTPTPPAPTGVAPPVQPQQPTPPASAEESWEQRARSTQGRLEQAMQTNSSLQQRMQALENTIATLKAAGVQEPTTPPEPTKLRLVTEQEAQDYGDEFLTVVGKRSREEFAPEFELLASRLAKIEGRVDGVSTVVTQNTRAGLYSALATAVPNWRDINVDTGFKEWLSAPDPYSGRLRADMLNDAFSGHEANRVINFFRGYVEASGLPQTHQANDPAAPPLSKPNGQASGKIPLESLAAPGRARSAPQSDVPPDKPVYTHAWIAKFTAEKLAGKYRGREADADAIEQDIYRAQHEGRIVP